VAAVGVVDDDPRAQTLPRLAHAIAGEAGLCPAGASPRQAPAAPRPQSAAP